MTLTATQPHPIYLAGRWVDSPDPLEVSNPADPANPAGSTYHATPEQYEEAVTAAVAAFELTRVLPAYERGRALREISSGIKARREELGHLMSLEAGKPIRDALIEIDRATLTFRLGAEEAERMTGEVIPLDLMASSKGRVGITRRFPIGPVAGISPFNFPLNLAAHKLAPAIAAGCSIVLKPPSKDPLTMLTVAEIVDSVGLPAGAVSILPMSRELGDRMVADDRFKLLSFTGSPSVGWRMKERAGKKKVVLELGGNAGVIVDRTADLDWAVKRILVGAFSYAGQVCISVQRMFIHEEVREAFLEKFLAGVAALKLGNPIEPATDVGPMVDHAAAERTQRWVDEAVAMGGKVLAGGHADGAFFEPTVLTDVPLTAQVCSNEAFAPLVVVFGFSDFDDAVRQVNDSFFGLQTGVFTNDLAHAWQGFNELEVGGVIVNDIPTYRIDNMPYGGVKDSGMGREGLRWSIEDMTELKILVLAQPADGRRAVTTAKRTRTAADLLVECLEAEDVEFVFSVPGEETMDILDSLSRSETIRHITTRHEQGAAFMADVYGRLTGRAAVAMGTLGPGATNLITGIADAYLDRAPIVAITGQAASDKLHKEAHQVVDIVQMFRPVTKWNTRAEQIGAIPEIVRKAFRVATLEKPGPTHIELPENIAATPIPHDADVRPLEPNSPAFPEPTDDAIEAAARLIAASERPLILAGNGVLRRHAAPALRGLAKGLHVPVAATFMGKGAIDDRSHLSLMAVGLQARDHVLTGFNRADLVIAVGYDLVEYAPARWNPDGRKRIVHIDTQPAEVDAAYQPEMELIGDIGGTLERLTEALMPLGIGGRDATARHEAKEILVNADLRTELLQDLAVCTNDQAFPIKPQRAIYELRRALGPDDIVVSDVGAHKIWVARLYQAYEPNTVIISNGFASMGIALPGAIGAKLVHPDRKVVALCGDGGFLMNSQELETAKRIGANVVVVIWRDDGYGLIDWKQRNEFGRPFGVEFGNPDFVAYAESFGIAGFRPSSADDLYPTLMRALDVDGPAVVEVPIDYRENLRLTEHLGALAGMA